LDYSRTPKTLGEFLLRERRRRKLLQKDVARELDVPVHSYLEWELRGGVPLPRNWPKLIEFLGVDPLEDLSNPRGRAEALRRRSGLTYRQIAAEVGVNRNTLVRWLLNHDQASVGDLCQKKSRLRATLFRYDISS
jgi:transcriptional regulator with XRE-family HTH domain